MRSCPLINTRSIQELRLGEPRSHLPIKVSRVWASLHGTRGGELGPVAGWKKFVRFVFFQKNLPLPA